MQTFDHVFVALECKDDKAILAVAVEKDKGRVEIINAFRDEEAIKLFEKLTGKPVEKEKENERD